MTYAGDPNPSIVNVALAVIEHQGLWLVQERRSNDEFAGLFEFPGGKMRDDETPEQAAVRETWEEVGVVIEPIGQLATIHHAYDHAMVILHPIRCRWVSGEPQARTSCVAGPRWVSPVELQALPMLPPNRSIVKWLSGDV